MGAVLPELFGDPIVGFEKCVQVKKRNRRHTVQVQVLVYDTCVMHGEIKVFNMVRFSAFWKQASMPPGVKGRGDDTPTVARPDDAASTARRLPFSSAAEEGGDVGDDGDEREGGWTGRKPRRGRGRRAFLTHRRRARLSSRRQKHLQEHRREAAGAEAVVAVAVSDAAAVVAADVDDVVADDDDDDDDEGVAADERAAAGAASVASPTAEPSPVPRAPLVRFSSGAPALAPAPISAPAPCVCSAAP